MVATVEANKFAIAMVGNGLLMSYYVDQYVASKQRFDGLGRGLKVTEFGVLMLNQCEAACFLYLGSSCPWRSLRHSGAGRAFGHLTRVGG